MLNDFQTKRMTDINAEIE